jgi:hypothetical protein
VPVGVCHEIKGYGPCIVAPAGGGSKRSKSGKLCKTFAAHPAELGHAFTLHRVQGRTVDRMVLEPNPRLTSYGAFSIKLGLELMVLEPNPRLTSYGAFSIKLGRKLMVLELSPRLTSYGAFSIKLGLKLMVLELSPRLTSCGAFSIKLGLKLTRKAMHAALSRVRDPRHLGILPCTRVRKGILILSGVAPVPC